VHIQNLLIALLLSQVISFLSADYKNFRRYVGYATDKSGGLRSE
jgi:hypothetical protein